MTTLTEKITAIIRLHYLEITPVRIYVGVVFSFMGSLLLIRYNFLFIDEGNTKISVAVKSDSTADTSEIASLIFSNFK